MFEIEEWMRVQVMDCDRYVLFVFVLEKWAKVQVMDGVHAVLFVFVLESDRAEFQLFQMNQNQFATVQVDTRLGVYQTSESWDGKSVEPAKFPRLERVSKVKNIRLGLSGIDSEAIGRLNWESL